MYPSFVFNPRRRYDPSTRPPRSLRNMSSSNSGTTPRGRRSFRAGSHSWDVLPLRQRTAKSITAQS